MNRALLILMILGLVLFLPVALIAADNSSESTTLAPEEQLGKALFFDKIASPDSMACADCHAPDTGFTGPNPGINAHGAVYRGAVPQRFGNRKPPSSAYATLSPIFHYDEEARSSAIPPPTRQWDRF